MAFCGAEGNNVLLSWFVFLLSSYDVVVVVDGSVVQINVAPLPVFCWQALLVKLFMKHSVVVCNSALQLSVNSCRTLSQITKKLDISYIMNQKQIRTEDTLRLLVTRQWTSVNLIVYEKLRLTMSTLSGKRNPGRQDRSRDQMKWGRKPSGMDGQHRMN